MTRTAVLVFAYPAALDFLPDFFVSYEGQTADGFTVVVVNDGIKDYDFHRWGKGKFSVEVVNGAGNLVRNRRIGFEYAAAQGYQSVILSDADDFYAPNRIEKSLELLKRYDIVVNDLDLFDRKGELLKRDYFSKRISDGTEIEEIYVRDKNLLGFGNCALRGSRLAQAVFDEDVIAIDWFVFSNLLLNGAKAVFTDQTRTFHRMYQGNMAALDSMDAKSVREGLKAKLCHYRSMAARHVSYQRFYERLRDLDQKISNEPSFFDSYLERLRAKSLINPLWYEEIES